MTISKLSTIDYPDDRPPVQARGDLGAVDEKSALCFLQAAMSLSTRARFRTTSVVQSGPAQVLIPPTDEAGVDGLGGCLASGMSDDPIQECPDHDRVQEDNQ